MIKDEAKTQELLNNLYINDVMDALIEELRIWSEEKQVNYYGKCHILEKKDCSWKNFSTLE